MPIDKQCLALRHHLTGFNAEFRANSGKIGTAKRNGRKLGSVFNRLPWRSFNLQVQTLPDLKMHFDPNLQRPDIGEQAMPPAGRN